MSPELNLGTPSLMFFSETLGQLHSDLSNQELLEEASNSVNKSILPVILISFI